MKRIMFDANAFSYLLKQNKFNLLEKSTDKYEYYITEIQVRELAEIPDHKRDWRIAHALCLCKMRAKLVNVRGVYGITHYGCCSYSNETENTYKKLLNQNRSNIDDALIGDAAKRENCTLITDDTRFINKLNANGICTMKFSDFLNSITQEVDL